MTVYRQPGSLEALIHETIRDASEAEIEDFTGKGLSYFQAVSNPNRRQQLSLVDGALLDKLRRSKKKPAVFLPAFLRLAEPAAPSPSAGAVAVEPLLRRAVTELGLLTASCEALDGGESRDAATAAQRLSDTAIEIRDATQPATVTQLAAGGAR